MNWNSISLKQYNNIKQIFLEPDFSEEDRIILLINILFGIDALKLKTTELNKFVEQLKFLNTTPPKMKIRSTYKLGENTYILKKDLKDFKVCQWIDFQNFLKNGSDTNNFANLLSVFFLPEGQEEYGENYNIEDVRNDINNHLSIADANSIASFFLTYQKILSIVFLLSTKRKIMKTPLEKKEKKKIKKEFRKLIWKTIFRGD